MTTRFGMLLLVASVACSPATIRGTSVVILANQCHLSKKASRAAEATMNRLVDACNVTVSHPLAFGVVLDPQGNIGFASIAGGSDEIPTCVAAQKLRHNVQLTSTCRLDVRFEPMSIVTH
jgi:hypothetical protein